MRILIAEDDRVSQLVLRKTLQVWGYDAVVVDNGEAALTALLDPDGPRPERVYLFILDGLSHSELLHQLDAEEQYVHGVGVGIAKRIHGFGGRREQVAANTGADLRLENS